MAKRFNNPEDKKMNEVLELVYNALKEKKYEPNTQITYYLRTDDEHHITLYNNARGEIQQFDSMDLLAHVVKYYFEN